jgi:DNA-binding MarR family transcriptional regulator
MKWRDLWPYAQTWWGWTVGVATVLFAIYQAPKPMFEAWDYYVDRLHDRAVYVVLKDRLISVPLRFYGPGSEPTEFPWYVADIAKATKRSERSVSRSLVRLEDKGKVERYKGGWRLKN